MAKTFTFQWHITDYCDQRCRHCYIFAGNGSKPLYNMNIGQMRDVVGLCEEFTAKLGLRPFFCISGGDPLLNPDFFKLMELLRDKEYNSFILGNPYHLTDEVCVFLKSCGVLCYQVSLDGAETTHDYFRKQGSYQKTLEAIPMISRNGIRAHVMMTVSQINYKELPDVMDAAEKYGADSFSFARYVPTSKDKENGIPPLEYRALLDTYMKKRREFTKAGSFTRFQLKDHLFTLYAYEEGLIKLPEYEHKPGEPMLAGCQCCNNNMVILPDGDVMACRRAASSVLGNIFKDDLSKLLEKDISKYRQYDKITPCNRCILSPWCRGCHAVAEGTTGDFFSPDPQCWHVVAKKEERKIKNF